MQEQRPNEQMPDEIIGQAPKKKKKTTGRKVMYWTTVGLLVAIIVGCLWIIGSKHYSDGKNQKEYEDLADLRDSVETLPRSDTPTKPTSTDTRPSIEDPDAPTEPAPDEPKTMLAQYKLMYELNSDTVGWIQIPGTKVDYPVVQSPYEQNFYLRRNFYKEKATCGTIYVREFCNVFEPSDNLTIYGHNMHNGTMFAALHDYEEKSFWEDNKYVYFDTLYEYHTYEIFAVFVSSADLSNGENFRYHLFDDARDQAEFDEFVSRCKELSLYDTGITPQYGEKLITLSTCDKSISDGRLVVVARRII